MKCEICSHACDENTTRVLAIFNEFYRIWETYWACPDCVHEYLTSPDHIAESR
jgi:hypothetical protein